MSGRNDCRYELYNSLCDNDVMAMVCYNYDVGDKNVSSLFLNGRREYSQSAYFVTCAETA